MSRDRDRGPRAEVVALDVSEEALAVARRNAERHQVTARVQFHRGDGLSALPDGAPPMDLIVSNPPYIPTAEIEGLEPEVRDYDPRLALDGGADGLEFHRRLAVEAPRRRVPDGWLAVEHGDGQADSISTLLGDAGWIVAERHQDYSGRGRFLLARRDPDPSKDQAASR
jgi:release factor glutamine methyltransferase